jgi:AraC-like DNA-binding protein
LERHFKKALGVTPFAMLRKKRLIASTAHLRNGETVTEAALKSGFSDYSNYIQLFRKQFGVTPLQYKKKFEMK